MPGQIKRSKELKKTFPGHKDIEYNCHLCPDKFNDLNDLNLHQYTHLTDKDTREKQVKIED